MCSNDEQDDMVEDSDDERADIPNEDSHNVHLCLLALTLLLIPLGRNVQVSRNMLSLLQTYALR